MKQFFHRLTNWYQNLPDKKKYLELFSAALTVPMLLTVIIINLNNIKGQKNTISSETPPTSTPIQIVITGSPSQENSPPTLIKDPPSTPTINPTITAAATTITPSPTTPSCLQEIGPIEILSPQEGEIITTDQVCLNISTNSKYCPLVWSYKLDNGSWSEFNSNDICLYNLDNGSKQLQVQFKNTSISKTVTLARNFTYQKASAITPTLTPTNSPTPTL